ncbi:lasso peptide isopeptide bond-forming cyclase [soil metagenome]
MFRYIALVWDRTVPGHAATARRLVDALQSATSWQAGLQRPGLHVYVKDAHPGINGVYPLRADQGLVVGKLFRRRDLGLPVAGNVSLSDHETADILRSGGRALVHDHWGRYVAFMPTPSDAVRVLRDPSGTLPCFVMRHDDVWIVFSWLEDILEIFPELPHPAVNWDGVAGHLLFGELAGRETALQGVVQVLPGEAIDLGGELDRSELQWDAVALARTISDDGVDVSAERLRHTVRACTRSWASCYADMLLRLSGGVDSSILLSCLDRGSTPGEVTCVNYHSPGSDSDERRYARLAATRAERTLIERERDPCFPLERVLTMARTPTPGNYVGRLNARVDAELAAEFGAQALFTGAGGDQLFFEFASGWPAADYLRCRGLDAGFFGVAMDAARLGKVSVWNTLALAIADRVRPAPPWREDLRHLPLIGPVALGVAEHIDRFVHPVLLRATGLPVGKLNQTRFLMHPVPYYDPLERDAAPEVVNPLLSQPLVEMCLRLPTWVLTHGGRGRALARQAFAAELPPEIAARRSKGGMEEHIKTVLLRNIEFARSLLLDGELVRRGLLDGAKVEEMLSGRPTTLASHLGRIHVYIGVEAWLRRWTTRPRGAVT